MALLLDALSDPTGGEAAGLLVAAVLAEAATSRSSWVYRRPGLKLALRMAVSGDEEPLDDVVANEGVRVMLALPLLRRRVDARKRKMSSSEDAQNTNSRMWNTSRKPGAAWHNTSGGGSSSQQQAAAAAASSRSSSQQQPAAAAAPPAAIARSTPHKAHHTTQHSDHIRMQSVNARRTYVHRYYTELGCTATIGLVSTPGGFKPTPEENTTTTTTAVTTLASIPLQGVIHPHRGPRCD